jgi:galactokinase
METLNSGRLLAALTAIYGQETHAQAARYGEAVAQFQLRFGPGPVDIYRAPGRVNLIGEHTDYNHGFVLPAALDKDILLLARPRSDRVVRLVNSEAGFPDAEFVLSDAIESAPRGHWSNYIRGAAQMVVQECIRSGLSAPPGLDVLVEGAAPLGVPRGAGLSSSSALVVAAAVALAHHAGWRPTGAELALKCADAEWYVGTRGGIMDHFAALLSKRDHGLFLDCRANPDGSYTTRHVPFPVGVRLVVVDSGVHHDNVRGEYNRRVAACRAGAALLAPLHPGATHLRDFQDLAWPTLSPLLPESTTPAELARRSVDLGELPGVEPDEPLPVRACCRHVWTENARVQACLDALQQDDIRRVGALLHEAHASAARDYAISTPELDFLTATAEALPGVYGARLTGAGWGGCVIVLVAKDDAGTLQTELSDRFAAHFGYRPAQFECLAGPGAAHVTTLDPQ